tara:strand:- start:506 stop:661 length:156 start_codon:yes stop_codon:yes gene_type:complete
MKSALIAFNVLHIMKLIFNTLILFEKIRFGVLLIGRNGFVGVLFNVWVINH